MTGRKPNNCLLLWHVINVLISAVIGLVHFVQVLEYSAVARENSGDDPCEILARQEVYYQILMIQPFQIVAEIYVDLFLLWLLYRFVKPSKVEKTNSDYFGILLTHDSEAADDNIEQ